MNNRTVFSRESDEWGTPQDVYDSLDAEFHFTLDPCATAENHKCDKYYTAAENGLEKSWGGGSMYFLIHLIVRSASGLPKHGRKAQRRTQWLLC